MIVAHYRFPRGSQIIIPLNFTSDDGELAADFAVQAWLRYCGFRPAEIAESMPKVGELEAEERIENAGWFLTMASDDLEPGFYATAPRLFQNDFSTPGDRIALIEITVPVTGGV